MTAHFTSAATSPTTSELVTQLVLPGIVEPSGLEVRHVTLQPAEAGQALIEMEATGVSFAEKAMRRGRYPGQPKFPFVPGYDVVGRVLAVGPSADASLVGKRVAAAVKIGGWASRMLVSADEMVPVPTGISAAEAETVIVNGITAWQMLYRKARAKPGQTILVHGAGGGVGTILAQIAIAGGMRVIGTASPRQHEALRALGVEPIDYNDPDISARVRKLSPRGVDAVFDHLGPKSVKRSFDLLDRGGALVAYGTALDLDKDNALVPMFIGLLGRLFLWNALPNSKRAAFYDFWEGGWTNPAAAGSRRREDLAKVFGLLASGAIKAMVAAEFPLLEARQAMERAEQRGVFGKVVIVA